MLLFPLIYTATILPLSIARIAAMAGHQLPPRYIAIAGSIFALNGFCNTVLYCAPPFQAFVEVKLTEELTAYTRRFVHVSFSSKRGITSTSESREHNEIATTTTVASHAAPPRQSFGFLQLSSSPAGRPDSLRKSIASTQSVSFGQAIPMGEMRDGKEAGLPKDMTTAFAIRLSQASMEQARTVRIAMEEEDDAVTEVEVIDDRVTRKM